MRIEGNNIRRHDTRSFCKLGKQCSSTRRTALHASGLKQHGQAYNLAIDSKGDGQKLPGTVTLSLFRSWSLLG
ncbi:hypothetical protein CYMTET_51915 [Cymbomonas tetramitiformis]|uniref:Uncharacterized protein n=1 Tax=Cymbomonas tetramitiformis TaxID=36881 RepID=A0AAE0ET78_9CHLO|nr:hypothetical protein CYMTET_51915 [Cymbomonas tetramitiformis]